MGIRETSIAKYGSEEAYKAEMKRRGALSNRNTPRGFATMDKEKAREISIYAAKKRWQKEKDEARGQDGERVS